MDYHETVYYECLSKGNSENELTDSKIKQEI